ncbi:MAG: baseplate J/gp47 family protein [Candidatus Hamiltonella defensa (Ceratovacuna japonica)]
MPHSGFSRPSLPTLIDTIRSDLFTRCQEDNLLRRCDAEVTARVQAAAVHTLYGYLDYLARNLLPDLADEAWLGRHANIKRCPRKGATKATGFVRWEGVPNALSMSSDTEIQRDDGQTYTTTTMTSALNGVLRVPVVAQEAGQAGNCEDRTALRLLGPIPGLSSTGYADEIQGGHDIEDLERWRQRIIARWYDIPQGGADGDYVRWAKEVSGIHRAWTHRHKNGPGTVGVMVATDDPDHPAPTQDILTQVREHILPLAPVAGSGLTVFAVTPKSVPVSLALSTDRPDIRSAVIAEIKAFFQREGEPGSTLFLSRLREVISLAAGEVAHQLRLPTTDLPLGKTEVPVSGPVTWTPYAP